jgi:hypothetical protein
MDRGRGRRGTPDVQAPTQPVMVPYASRQVYCYLVVGLFEDAPMTILNLIFLQCSFLGSPWIPTCLAARRGWSLVQRGGASELAAGSWHSEARYAQEKRYADCTDSTGSKDLEISYRVAACHEFELFFDSRDRLTFAASSFLPHGLQRTVTVIQIR